MVSTYSIHATPGYSSKLNQESYLILNKLNTINKLDAMTTNSQPGIIYEMNEGIYKNMSQKAYLCMFVHKNLAEKMYNEFKKKYVTMVVHDKKIIYVNFKKLRHDVTYLYKNDGTIDTPTGIRSDYPSFWRSIFFSWKNVLKPELYNTFCKSYHRVTIAAKNFNDNSLFDDVIKFLKNHSVMKNQS
jgi:hypothetical protein